MIQKMTEISAMKRAVLTVIGETHAEVNVQEIFVLLVADLLGSGVASVRMAYIFTVFITIVL